MSCCGSCAHGRKCEGKKKRNGRKPKRYITSKKPGDATYSAQWSGVTGAPIVKGKKCVRCGGKVHREGDSNYCPYCDDYVRANPNFLYLANGRRGRRRRNPASNTWIYQANGRRRKNPFRVVAQKLVGGSRGAPSTVATKRSMKAARSFARAYERRHYATVTHIVATKRRKRRS